jgi:exodeoxyribonuclease X
VNIARVIDFETTGTEPPAEVCEVGICDLLIDDRTVLPPVSWLCGVKSMPPAARAVHHITPHECLGQAAFDPARIGSDQATVVAAHNAEFETKFFTPTVPVLCTYKAALRVWPQAPAHNNWALRYWLTDLGLIDPEWLPQPPHRAGHDAWTTAHILLALLNTGATGREMVAWTREPRLLPNCPIGKFRGKPWSDVDGGFLSWMLRQEDMEADLKWNAGRELDKRREA